jgi:riboflavin biosynthesis pyrimidine reductase
MAECICGDISDFSGAPMKNVTTHSEHSISFLIHVSQSMIMSLTIKIGTDIYSPAERNPRVSIIATIVVGADGSSSIKGSSKEVTSASDRESFLKRRRLVDCIIIGGNTARNEPYSKTPVPLVVVSRQEHPNLPAAHVWNLDPEVALAQARKEFGENILIEGGSSFITYLLEKNAIDLLELSVTSATGGSHFFDYEKFLSLAESVEKNVLSDTTFYTANFKKQK